MNPITAAMVVFMASLAGLSAFTLVNGYLFTGDGGQMVFIISIFLGAMSGLLEWPGLKRRAAPRA